MSVVESKLEGIEAQLELMRKIIERLEERLAPEPTVLTFPKAAARLGVGLTKLKQLVKSGQLRPALVGEVKMIPMSEIHRLSTPPPERAKVEAKTRREAWVPIPVGRKRR